MPCTVLEYTRILPTISRFFFSCFSVYSACRFFCTPNFASFILPYFCLLPSLGLQRLLPSCFFILFFEAVPFKEFLPAVYGFLSCALPCDTYHQSLLNFVFLHPNFLLLTVFKDMFFYTSETAKAFLGLFDISAADGLNLSLFFVLFCP